MQKADKPLMLTSPVITPSLLHEITPGLTRQELDFLKSAGLLRRYSKDSIIARQDDYIDKIMFLEKGMVRSVGIGADGAEKTFLYFSAGCFLGLEGVLHCQPVIYDLQVLEDSNILLIDNNRLGDLLTRKNIGLFMLRSLALSSRILAHQVEDATFRTTEQAICRILYCLSDREQMSFKPFFTHQEIANLVGAHRVTVTHILGMIKKEGIIDVQARGHVMVVDREKLRKKIFEEP